MKSFIKELSKNRYLYSMAIPGLAFLLIFAYIPMFGHLIAFKDFKISQGLWGSQWVGFKNFKFFFESEDWLHITLNTLFLNGLFLFSGITFAIILALCLNEMTNTFFKKIAQSIIFLPYFVSWMVVGMMTLSIFNSTSGLLNKFLVSVGMQPINWYQRAELWPAILTIIYVWKFSGYNSIIFLSAITSISDEYYESAKIDGATRFQQIRFITLPLIKPITIILILLGLGRIFFGDFGMIYSIVGDNSLLYPTTDVIDTYSFRALRQIGNFSMSAAIVFYQSLMGFLTMIIFNFIIKKIDKDYSLF